MPFTRRHLGHAATGASCPTTCSAPGLWSATFCLLGYIFWRASRRSRASPAGARSRSAILLALVRRRLPGVQAPARPRAAPALRAPGSSARRSGRCCARSRLVGRGAVVRVCGRSGATCCARSGALIAPPLRFLDRAPHPGRARHRVHDPARDRRRVDLHRRPADRPDRDGDALITGDQTGAATSRATSRCGVLTTLAKVAGVLRAALGRGARRVLAACAFLLARRRVAEAVALSAGLVDHARSRSRSSRRRSTGRGRGDGLVDVERLRAIPSGHAALAVTYLALAVVLARAGARRLAARAGARRRSCWRSRSASRASTCASTT